MGANYTQNHTGSFARRESNPQGEGVPIPRHSIVMDDAQHLLSCEQAAKGHASDSAAGRAPISI